MPTPRILIVDNEPGIRDGIKWSLEHIGFNSIDMAGDGLEAIKFYNEFKPEICILDVGLDGATSGLDVLREIKKVNIKTRCVMYTVYRDDETVKEARESGADTYNLKMEPGAREALRETIVEMAREIVKERP